jgi:hypothetical protein
VEALLRFLVMKYGTDVLDWSVRKMFQTEAATAAPGCDVQDECERVLERAPLGARLDPDCGVFFWDLPSKEQ